MDHPPQFLETLCTGSVENEAHDKDTNAQSPITCDNIHGHFATEGLGLIQNRYVQYLSFARHMSSPQTA